MIPCIGLASGLGAGNVKSGEGPLFLKDNLSSTNLFWHNLIEPKTQSNDKFEIIAELNSQLAQDACELARAYPFFFSFGGDHSSAIGVWSGVAEAKREEGDIGLVWIDAHMDSHTPETSESGNIHGMPLATLLGRGVSSLTQILSSSPKLKPENVVLIGIRSFELGEAELLKQLNVKVHFMDEVHQKGLLPLIEEAVADLSTRTVGYGISFDLDALDPKIASAVGTPADDGISKNDFFATVDFLSKNPPLAIEIVEYIPSLDESRASFLLIDHLVSTLSKSVQIVKPDGIFTPQVI